MAAITVTEYQILFFDLLDLLDTDIIQVAQPGATVNKRYISSDGRNDEQWLGFLRDESGVVDRWLITANMLSGQNPEEYADTSVNSFTKPISIVIDYFADYRQGLDAVGPVGSETVTNTEREFLKKMLAVDLLLEQKRRCLQSQLEIIQWDFNLRLRRFQQATTHWGQGIIKVQFTELFLS